MDLTSDIKYLPGVGPQRAKMLNEELSIHTLGDLLYYFPYKHIDRTRIFSVYELRADMPYVQLKGYIRSIQEEGMGRKHRLVAHFSDGTGFVDLVWFQGVKWTKERLKMNQEYIVFGKPQVFNGRINLSHPDLEPAENLRLSTMGMQPTYSVTEKMRKANFNSRALEHITSTMFQKLTVPIEETLPEKLLRSMCLMGREEALRTIHYPANAEQLSRATYRLKFEELFFIQLSIQRYAMQRQSATQGHRFRGIGSYFNGFYERCLPFELTGAQKRVIREMWADMKSGKQMNRLLQGDVGSGKTLVALLSMLLALDNGFQACIMAPTEILAEQHLETFRSFLKDLPVRVELLTGIVKGKRRAAVLEGLKSGEVQILVGTHAVLEDNVEFHNLGMVVIDEQHRFGVAQRARLWRKNTIPPHVLVMTATPIPRTLAMTLYGDLDVSIIDELPPGRKPIRTVHHYDNRREELYAGIRKQIDLGRQVYVVFPLIKESEKRDMKNLEDGYEHLRKVFPDLNISKVHGKMKPAEKDAEMQRFVNGETQILVATTVIEVGVNVPNASVMVIENAEQFGLAQLHQLRGRVGRGAEQSYCILVTKYELGQDTRRRIQIMTETTDGFEIAEADLKFRGPGDLEGTQQSGTSFDLRLANLARDGQLVQYARDRSREFLEADPTCTSPENQCMWRRLSELNQHEMDWSSIS